MQQKREELREQEKNNALPSMNGNLQATVPATKDIVEETKKTFGDLADVVRVDEGFQLKWRPEILKETVLQKKDFRVECGIPQQGMIDALKSGKTTSPFADEIEGKQLVFDQSWRDQKRSRGGTHLNHFYQMEDQPDDIPIKPEDLEMLPSMWRKPTRIRKNKQDEFDLELDTIDGSTFIMRVKIAVDETTGDTYPKLWTFFRTTDPASKKNGPPKQVPKP